MGDYFSAIALQLGIPVWLLVIIFIWSYSWKLLALWKSARKGSPIWFIVLALVNTVGILEILYIFGFSKMKFFKQRAPARKKRT
jgi:methionyl-tRNA synthetase